MERRGIQDPVTPLTVDDIVRIRQGRNRARFVFFLITLALVVWSIQVTVVDDTDWERIGSVSQIMADVSRFIGIDFKLIPNLLGPALETFMIATMGTLLGLIICIPAIWFGALNVTPVKLITYPLARIMMTLSRSVHEIVWALIFVSAVGLGALAGVLAIAARSLGFIAKISAEAIENIDPKPVEAIRAVGGNNLQVMLFAILPQVMPVIVGVVIFEWEINIRRSAVLGLVGAGGLGLVFFRQMNTFNFPGVTTVILAILVLIVLGEVASYYSRKALI
ncbi:MAG: phosphonate ABC transporter, permease protein PhnE [Gammaproteobacteria bacterium]|nr:MAG: phosphonate ABC transporter, permease protein PhnE [Gammaproteobacteria bacterium]